MRPWDLAYDASVHDDLLHGRTAEQGSVGRLFHCHEVAAPVETVGAAQHLRLAVTQASGYWVRAVAGKQGDDHRADLRRGEPRGGDLGADRWDVTGADAG